MYVNRMICFDHRNAQPAIKSTHSNVILEILIELYVTEMIGVRF